MESNLIHQAEVEITVPFHDIELMEVAWHGHYVKYFEIARCELLDTVGYNYHEMKESGYAWPVIDMRIRYPKPSVFNQKIIVKAKLVEWENRLKIDYLIVDKMSSERLTRGYRVQVAVDMRTREMCLESPPVLLEKLGLLA